MSNRILISGATGFIAGHTIERLLAEGHDVVGTVRNPSDKEKTSHLLAMKGAEKNLELVAADLTDDDPFGDYVDVDTVMHMASPYMITVQDAQRDLVDPAVEGTLSMLRAAATNKRVKRVVLTSSMAAITDQPDGRVLSEADWNTQSSLKRNPYYFSKAMAERAAWDFMDREKPGFDLVVINPSLVIGPSLTPAINTSIQIFVDLVNGQYPAIMALDWGIVDARDVADAHMAAMNTKLASGRYICSNATMTMTEIVAQLRQSGFSNTKLPKIDLSGAFGTRLMKLASYTQPSGVGSYLRTNLGKHLRFDNSKIRNELKITFRDVADSIDDTMSDLKKWGHIPQKN